jgi:hypothetical protein
MLLRLRRWQAQPGQPDRVFNPDSSDRRLVGLRRGDHNRLGFALQLTACGSWAPFRRDVPPQKAELSLACARRQRVGQEVLRCPRRP